MARSTIGLRIDTLRELGLLMPVSDAASTGGRPSARIAFNQNARVVLAADIGATQHLTIELSHSGKKAGIAGASILAIEHALSPERLEAISSTAGELQRV